MCELLKNYKFSFSDAWTILAIYMHMACTCTVYVHVCVFSFAKRRQFLASLVVNFVLYQVLLDIVPLV